MAWVGLERYGYLEDAQRLAYRFLYMCVFTAHTNSSYYSYCRC
jgi:neutral trehalase